MSKDRLPCVDGSGRGLDDGECVHCGDSGNIDNRECAVRLRERLDALMARLDVLVDNLDVRAAASRRGVRRGARAGTDTRRLAANARAYEDVAARLRGLLETDHG